jgi:pimeloyl-ACP methyl ester carboxylesterase
MRTQGTSSGPGGLRFHFIRLSLRAIPMNDASPLPSMPLPPGIRSRHVPGINGLTMLVLEAGFERDGRPLVLLLHGFPELAWSWRRVMLPLARAGFHVVAPDQRGYGRTTGWDPSYDGDLASFGMLNLARDAIGLVAALGRRSVAAVVGHDFGSPVAAWCALLRPDVFRSVVMMSAPFGGPPELPFDTMAPSLRQRESGERAEPRRQDIHAELAALDPPRKHYTWYYSQPEANDDMWRCPQGVHAFLRAYYHYKSADWPGNRPFPLAAWTAPELAKMPTYYIMELDQGMAETVAPMMPASAGIVANRWLPDEELRVYSEEYERTGFQGGLQWYRAAADERLTSGLQLFAGRHIEVPAAFIAGKADWGVYQKPGAFEAMQSKACPRLLACDLVDGAGHWVQQEQAEETSRLLVEFLARTGTA